MVEEINNIVEGLFIPTWDNKPPYRKPILSVNGEGILKFQNISCIIAAPGKEMIVHEQNPTTDLTIFVKRAKITKDK